MKYYPRVITLLWGLSFLFLLGLSWYFYPYEYTPDWLGIKRDANGSISTKITKTCKEGGSFRLQQPMEESSYVEKSTLPSPKGSHSSNGEETLEVTITEQQPKTLWDFLGLLASLGIPLAVYLFQIGERKRAEDDQQESIFQNYIDRISETLVDPQRKQELLKPKPDECAEIDVVRIRTITTLRQLQGNRERFNRVFDFLRDSDLYQILFRDCKNLSSSFEGISFDGANLSRLNFARSNLTDINFSGANLSYANFSSTDLTKANLENANLSHADCTATKMENAKLKGTNFAEANFCETILTGSNYKNAKGLDTSLSSIQIKTD